MLNKLRKWQKPFAIFSFAVVATLLSLIIWIMTLNISDLENPLPEPTYIIDHTGEVISQISSSNITPMPLEKIHLIYVKQLLLWKINDFISIEG